MELVYHYLPARTAGSKFRLRVQAIVEAFSGMEEDLAKEKKLITKHWAKREKQISRVMEATVGIYGELEGIAAAESAMFGIPPASENRPTTGTSVSPLKTAAFDNRSPAPFGSNVLLTHYIRSRVRVWPSGFGPSFTPRLPDSPRVHSCTLRGL